MSTTRKHPRRLVSGIPPELWQAAQVKAAAKGTSVSAEIVRFLERWVKR